MEFFASADQFQQLETAAANGAARSFAPLLSLAWQLRQRDTARALKLADEVAAALANAGLSDAERCRSSARLQLIKAEACWLRGQTESAQAPLDAAFAGFGAIDDHTGVGDAYWLAAFLAQNQGATEQRDRALASALSHYDLAGETLRRAAVQARMVFHAAFRDPLAAAKQWETLGTTGEQDHPLIQAWRMAARGVIHALGGRQTEAVRAFLQAHEAALACGNLNLAGNCANNAADAFAQSNELAAALEWSEHGLAIGRRIDNPSLIAAACSYLGNCLRQLGRLDEARARLNEALSVLVRIPNSPSHLTVYNYLAELALDAGDDAAALSWSSQCEIRAISAKRREQQTISLRLQARALGHLGQTEAALEKVNASLALGRESANAQWQIDALCTLAELHRQHPLPAPEGMTAATAALHYAEQALAIAASRHDLATPPQLLEDAANDYAQLGLHQNAYDLLKLAGKLREDTRRKEAIARAMAMQVRHELNQVQGEMLRQREQSAAEAERLALLERTNSTLEVLGVIGREITGKLDREAIYESLYRHLQVLLDVFSFFILAPDADWQNQTVVYGMEDGQPVEPLTLPFRADGPGRRCLQERRAVVVNDSPGSVAPIPGTVETLSIMCAPLIVGDRLQGLLTVQSPSVMAYGERELAIFKSLVAYGAIALDNANTYERLQLTLAELRSSKAQLEEMSLTDPLTGLRNRRFLLQHLDADVELTQRHYANWLRHPEQAEPVEMGMLFFVVDIDHFKAVNDIHGHAAGDQVLVGMRQRLQQVFRAADYLVRWGGEEFLIVARQTRRHDARIIAERVRAAVAGETFALEGSVDLPKTCSIGFASYPFFPRQADALSWAQVVELADQCLYMAKRAGRNCWAGALGLDTTQAPPDITTLLQQPLQAAQSGYLQILQSFPDASAPATPI